MASFVIGGDTSGQLTIQAPSIAGSNTITWPAETGTVMTTATVGNAAAGQIKWNLTPQTSSFTAVTWGGYFVNTTSGAVTVTLPATPTRGNFVVIVDYAGTAATNNITVNPNGSNLNSGSGNAIISTNRQGITFTYIDSTQGWLASSNVYGGSTPFAQPYSVSYLTVAGGGGATQSGAGGAGGLLTGTVSLTPSIVYTITIGNGGTGQSGNDAIAASVGGNSILSGSGITTVTALGGGGGLGTASAPFCNGGSGGGVQALGAVVIAGGTGTPGQGNNGGSNGSNASPYPSGGGGGAGAVGGSGSGSVCGSGGIGVQSSITGVATYYAGGGGGGTFSSATAGSGGLGGGAAGTPSSTGTGPAGTANTGGGGGGGGNNRSGGNGGSGVVILSVPTAKYTGTTTGSPTVTTSGSNTILKYTASGTYTA